MQKTVNLKVSPKQRTFIETNDIIAALIGPQGEGKTFAGFIAMLFHRHRQPKGKIMRGCIIRDTFESIKRMTIPSMRDAAEAAGVDMNFSNGGRRLHVPGAQIDMIGIDSVANLNKIHGAEYAFIWLEEPAPILDKGNAGLVEEVFQVGLTRVARQKDSTPRMQITMNPADEDHWTYRILCLDPINDNPKYPGINTNTIFIPYGENVNLTDIARETVKAGYKDNPELYARYVEGKFSFVTRGERVMPEYNEDVHLAKVKLDPIKGVETFRFWDGGLNPTCVIAQLTPSGRIFVLDTLRGSNMGTRQLITTQLKPLLETRYIDVESWRDIGDPAMSNREQSDSNQSAAQIIQDELGTNLEPGPTHWNPRRESLKECLNRMVDGKPMLLVSKHEGILNRALRGGWHYRKNNSGDVLRDKAEKDIHSHPGDALSYGIGRLLPWKAPRRMNPRTAKTMKNRAKGYAANNRRTKGQGHQYVR